MNKYQIRKFAKTAKTVSELSGIARASIRSIARQRSIATHKEEETFTIDLIKRIRKMGGADAIREIQWLKYIAEVNNETTIVSFIDYMQSVKK